MIAVSLEMSDEPSIFCVLTAQLLGNVLFLPIGSLQSGNISFNSPPRNGLITIHIHLPVDVANVLQILK